jgi:ribosomal protein S18 acetylase RimI-like enzyme
MRFFRPPHRVVTAHPAEAAAIARLYERSWEDAGATITPAALREVVPSREEVVAWFGGGFEIYRTEQDSTLVGAVRLSFPAGSCHLDQLVVMPQFRRKGHGRSLVEHAVGRARRAGATRVWAQVSPRLHAGQAFFASMGFQVSSPNTVELAGEPLLLLELAV